MKLIPFPQGVETLEPTAAYIQSLDLVISVDTVIAHLAGALGKEVWTMLPVASDWRWQIGKEDSQWYPSMRLFRQSERGSWHSVVERIAHELRRQTSESNPKFTMEVQR
jgi:ADP-heptose:LPS heptosyltransferase